MIFLFFSGCDADFGKSCYLAGMFHKLKFPKPITTEQNPRNSKKLFERACDLDQTTGCHYYASALLKPGADQNLHKAAEAFGKACDKGWFFLLRPEIECRFGAVMNDRDYFLSLCLL